MRTALHVYTRHDVEYGYSTSVNRDTLLDWLYENDVDVCGADTDEWEIDKSQLEAIPPSAYKDLTHSFDGKEYAEIDRDKLWELVRELIDSEADEYTVFISWF